MRFRDTSIDNCPLPREWPKDRYIKQFSQDAIDNPEFEYAYFQNTVNEIRKAGFDVGFMFGPTSLISFLDKDMNYKIEVVAAKSIKYNTVEDFISVNAGMKDTHIFIFYNIKEVSHLYTDDAGNLVYEDGIRYRYATLSKENIGSFAFMATDFNEYSGNWLLEKYFSFVEDVRFTKGKNETLVVTTGVANALLATKSMKYTPNIDDSKTIGYFGTSRVMIDLISEKDWIFYTDQKMKIYIANMR